MAANVVHNEDFYKQLGQAPGVVQLARRGAEALLDEAKATAPVDSREYLESLHIERSSRPGRVTFLVVADAEHSLLVEAREGTLARATKRVGLA